VEFPNGNKLDLTKDKSKAKVFKDFTDAWDFMNRWHEREPGPWFRVESECRENVFPDTYFVFVSPHGGTPSDDEGYVSESWGQD
jgi:hypothetical protein